MRKVVKHRGRPPENPSEAQFTMYDVSGTMFSWLQTGGERFVQDVFHDVLDAGCSQDSSPEEAWKQGVVIDIGSNSGFYGLLALAHGCAVIFVEPQPECNDLISMSIEASGFDQRKVHRVQRPLGGGDSMGKSLEVQPENHCEGRFPIVNKEHHHSDAYGSVSKRGISVPFLPVEEMLSSAGLGEGSSVLLLKLDTEGFELKILQALMPALRTRYFANLVVEVTPMWWGNTGFQLRQGAELLEGVAALGYRGRTITRSFQTPAEVRHWVLYDNVYQEDLWLSRKH